MTEGVRSASNRLYTLATRATLPEAPDDKQLFQEMTAHGFAGEVHTEVEHPTSYGFTHNPLPPTGKQAAEIFMVYLGASRSNPVAMLVGDRRYRLGGLEPGEVGTHDDQGQQHVHHRDGTYASVPHDKIHQQRVQQDVGKPGKLNPISPFASGQQPQKPRTPHSYKHHAADLMQGQHPQQINHHIITGPAIPPNVSSALTSLSGLASQIGAMAGQIGTLATAGLGVPGINSLGSQISSLVSQITGAGVTPAMGALVGQITTGAVTAAAASSTTGIAAIAARIQSLTASLQSMMGGGMSQIIHKSEHSLASGLLHSVFQGQSQTTHGQSNITHTTSKHVTNAPNIFENGNAFISNNLTSGPQFAPSYNVDSDRRLKTNIADHTPVLDKLLALKVKTFNVKRVLHRLDGSIGTYGEPATPSHGLIAQEVRDVFPLIVHGDEGKEFLSVSEHKIGILVLQGLQEFVLATREELARIHTSIAKLKAGSHA